MATFCNCLVFYFIFYFGHLNNTSMGIDARFIKYSRYEDLDGLVCSSEHIMMNNSVQTWVECALLCLQTHLCFGLFYNPRGKYCTGCTYFMETETLTRAGTKFYGRRGYEIIEEKLTWTQAKDNCYALGGYLASVNSLREQQLLDQILDTNGYDGTLRIWIGGNDMSTEGIFTWEDESVISDTTFSNWSPGQPNNYQSQNCIDLYKESGKWFWNDERCDEKLISLCEIN